MNLRTLTDDQLGDVLATACANGDQTTQRAVQVECDRRDRRDRQKLVDKARWARVTALYAEYLNAQWDAAETFCNGQLLNKAGRAAGIDARTLWEGTAAHAARYASEELLEFWAHHPRYTISQFQKEQRAARRAEREQYAGAAA